jgi:hypothetical protein
MTGSSIESSKSSKNISVFVHWEKTVHDLLARTEKFPKKVRFTFSTRIDNLALDIFEWLVEARYRPDKQPILDRINLDLEKLRLLIRLSHDARYLDKKGFEQVVRNIAEAGRMVGGWRKSLGER